MRSKATVGSFACFAMLAGCIAVPISISDPEPYRGEEIGRIVPGETDKQSVIDEFGSPDSTFADSRWLVFRTDRELGDWFVAAGAGYYGAVDIVEGGVVEYRLVVGLDDNHLVRSIGVVTAEAPCNADRTICLADDGKLQLATNLRPPLPAEPGECILYFYASKPASPGVAITVELDDATQYAVWSDEIYLRASVAPGEHKLEAIAYLPAYFFERLHFACEAESSQYFLMHHEVDADPGLTNRSAPLGESDVASRRSIVQPDGPDDLRGEEQ